MSEVELSIIIPVFNSELYLDRCLKSILLQTFSNFEVILIDDGSTDRSGYICDEFAAKDSRIKSYHKENGGQSSARNMGLSVATGKYISFVDSDDFIHPQMYEIMLNQLSSSISDTVVCSYERCKKTDNVRFNSIQNDEISFKTIDNQEIIDNYWKFAKGELGMAPWNKVYKKKIFDGLRFVEGIIYEDHFILPEIILRSKVISFTDLRLYYYYQSPNSTIRSGFSRKKLSSLYVWKESILPFLSSYSNRSNIDLAESYYINEFKLIIHMVSSDDSYKDFVIDKEYKKLYKQFVVNQHKINPFKEGAYYSLSYLLSIINIGWAYKFTTRFLSERSTAFWNNG